MRCIIVDDERLAREGLEELVERTPFLEHCGSFGSAFKAMEFLNSNSIDLLLLDIQMPDMTGLELMKVLPSPPKVIFTTAYREYAVDGFELNAVDYLLKPISYERFLKAIQKVHTVGSTGQKEEAYIFVKSESSIVKIPLNEILFFETAKDYIFIHTTQKRYMTLVPLRQVEEKLPEEHFIRVHRSYVVGLKHITKMEGNLLFLGDKKVPISRRMKDEVYKRIVGNRLIERS